MHCREAATALPKAQPKRLIYCPFLLPFAIGRSDPASGEIFHRKSCQAQKSPNPNKTNHIPVAEQFPSIR